MNHHKDPIKPLGSIILPSCWLRSKWEYDNGSFVVVVIQNPQVIQPPDVQLAHHIFACQLHHLAVALVLAVVVACNRKHLANSSAALSASSIACPRMSALAMAKALVVALVAIAAVAELAAAKNHTIQWSVSGNYGDWSASSAVSVGDTVGELTNG